MLPFVPQAPLYRLCGSCLRDGARPMPGVAGAALPGLFGLLGLYRLLLPPSPPHPSSLRPQRFPKGLRGHKTGWGAPLPTRGSAHWPAPWGSAHSFAPTASQTQRPPGLCLGPVTPGWRPPSCVARGPVSDTRCSVGFVWLPSPSRCGSEAGSPFSFMAESKSPLPPLSK